MEGYIDVLEPREEEEQEEEEEENEMDWRLPSAVLPNQKAQNTAIPGADPIQANPSASSDIRVSNMELNVHKAGMEGLDKERINKIIMEASKGSRFFENQKKREQQTGERIERMMEALAKLTNAQKQAALSQVDAMARELEAGRDLSRTIVHLDMDMFYAAVEMRDDPSLRDKPMAVGGMGMLSTSNYKARRFGVRAAMPGFIGKKLCPQLVIVPPHFDKYRAVSQEIRAILAEYDPNFCPMSLDEAYFDLTNHLVKRQKMSVKQRTFPYRLSNDSVHDRVNSDFPETSHEDYVRMNHDHRTSEHVGCKSSDKNVTCCRHNDGDIFDQQPGSNSKQACVSDSNIHQCLAAHTVEHSHNSENAESTSVHLSDENLKENGGIVNKELGIMKTEESPTEEEDGKEEEIMAKKEKRNMNREVGSRMERSKEFETFGLTCEEAVREIRFRIEQKTRLTASAGIAPNCMLAKICSDKNKPNGQFRIQPTREAVMEFIKDLPIRKISGIGKVTERMLSALGIQTCTDLYQQRALFHLLFSPTSSNHFLHISLGLGSTHVERDGERKSMSTERTFREISNPKDLYSKCRELCESLAEELSEEQIIGKTVTIKLKTVNFDVKTRSASLKAPVGSASEIYAVAKNLLTTEIRACQPQPLRLRLMGVRLSALQDGSKASKSRQGSLLDLFSKKQTLSKNNEHPQDITAQNKSNLQSLESSSLKYAEATPEMSKGRVTTAMPEIGGTRTCDEACDLPIEPVSALLARTCPELNSATQVEKEDSGTNSPTELDGEEHLNSVQALSLSETDKLCSSAMEQKENAVKMMTRDSALLLETLERSKFPVVKEEELHDYESTKLQDRRGDDSPDVSNETNVQRNVNTESAQSFICPICGVERDYGNLDEFNQHIDVCLNKSAIKEILKKDVPGSSLYSETHKRQSPKKTAKLKRGHPGSSSSSKKRKSDQGGSRTLHHFFQNQGKD